MRTWIALLLMVGTLATARGGECEKNEEESGWVYITNTIALVSYAFIGASTNECIARENDSIYAFTDTYRSNFIDELVASGEVVRVEASSVVVTNVSETDNAVWGYSGQVYLTWPVQYGEEVKTPATEKTTTTTVIRKHTLTFEWRGETWYARDEEVLSEDVQRFMKKETWEPR